MAKAAAARKAGLSWQSVLVEGKLQVRLLLLLTLQFSCLISCLGQVVMNLTT